MPIFNDGLLDVRLLVLLDKITAPSPPAPPLLRTFRSVPYSNSLALCCCPPSCTAMVAMAHGNLLCILLGDAGFASFLANQGRVKTLDATDAAEGCRCAQVVGLKGGWRPDGAALVLRVNF